MAMMSFGGFQVQEIAPEEVQRRLEAGEKLNLVDIREPFEWEQTGVIPGARLAPMRPFLLTQLDSLDKEEEIILVCHSGGRTYEAALYMMAKGFKNAKSMAGGMKAWQGPRVAPEIR
jgi:rhodanese-related sulfurtransferase